MIPLQCPICDKEISSRKNDYIGNSICEEYIECKDEHHYYSYIYAYGNEAEVVGNVTFHRHYNESMNQGVLISDQFDSVLKLERKNYQNNIDCNTHLEKRSWLDRLHDRMVEFGSEYPTILTVLLAFIMLACVLSFMWITELLSKLL